MFLCMCYVVCVCSVYVCVMHGVCGMFLCVEVCVMCGVCVCYARCVWGVWHVEVCVMCGVCGVFPCVEVCVMRGVCGVFPCVEVYVMRGVCVQCVSLCGGWEQELAWKAGARRWRRLAGLVFSLSSGTDLSRPWRVGVRRDRRCRRKAGDPWGSAGGAGANAEGCQRTRPGSSSRSE